MLDMSRAPLIYLPVAGILWLCSISGFASGPPNPHMDPSAVPEGCPACHAGHGEAGSPMLPKAQVKICLSCHGKSNQSGKNIVNDFNGVSNRRNTLHQVFAKSFVHPIQKSAYSQNGKEGVTCTSCHSPHRGMRRGVTGGQPTGEALLSPKDPTWLEYELCEGCHGSAGVETQNLLDISRMLNPGNASFHPVESPTFSRSISVIPSLSGRQINCTDCHGNDDPSGPKGPHGSNVPFLLRSEYVTGNGRAESSQTYSLCYSCHDRDVVLDLPNFPEHANHIVDNRVSCATCHSAHGSVINSRLIRFGEETHIAGVSPSLSTGKLSFVSDGAGSGACFLTCHGHDHGPEGYGLMDRTFPRGLDVIPFGPYGFRIGQAAIPGLDQEQVRRRSRDSDKKRKKK